MKKFIFFIALTFLGLFFFHKPVLGAAIRWAVKKQEGCELTYRSLNWKRGALVFSDLTLSDECFHAHIDEVCFQFEWKTLWQKKQAHLLIVRPYISLLKQRDLSKTSSGKFTITASITDGILDWEGRLARVSYQDQKLVFDWGESKAVLSFKEGKTEAELQKFNAQLLKSFIPFGDLSAGFLTGRVTIDRDFQPYSAHLHLDQIRFATPTASIIDLRGTLSFNANFGAKWELEGVGRVHEKPLPFTFQGRGFFKSHWVESEIHFPEAFCKINKDSSWVIECHNLQPPSATLLQAGISVFWPEVADWTVVEGVMNATAKISFPLWKGTFEGENLTLRKGNRELSCLQAKGSLSQEGGDLTLKGKDYDLTLSGSWDRWMGDARFLSGQASFRGGWDGEKCVLRIEQGAFDRFQFTGNGWLDSNLDFSFELGGEWSILRGKVPFYCSQFTRTGENWAFDFRFERKTWDLLRLVGTFDGKRLLFQEKSHLLGNQLHFLPTELGTLDVSTQLSWKSILATAPVLKEWNFDLGILPKIDQADLHFQYRKGSSKVEAKGASPLFSFSAEEQRGVWKIDLVSDLTLHGFLEEDGEFKGVGSWKGTCEGEFEGKIHPNLHCEVSLPKVQLDLSQLDLYQMEGKVEGQGHLIYHGTVEADLDFAVSSLKINSLPLENEGPIHLYYAMDKEILLRGINLHGPLDCIVDLLEYDVRSAHWLFHETQVHLPGSFLTHRFLQFLDRERDLNFTADLDFTSDFSTFACTMRDGLIPFQGATHPIENLYLLWDQGAGKASFRHKNQSYRFSFHVDEKVQGRFILGEEEMPLTIDWRYEDALCIHSIEGSFGGIDASFHAESENTLIGSAHIDFTALSEFLPPDVAEVFAEIKMGKGYELKGKLKIEKNLPYFEGILGGKQIELFGFQFRTLFAQVNLGPEFMRIYDVKISDTAGMMKIDEIILKDQQPWTLSIPQLAIIDLRPSLLQRPGESVGPISPLVIRELKISDFNGVLDDGNTYTATGQLHFINSYKREETVFDAPANVLSRIVGLDLELLIPVCGDLSFDLKDGLFRLKELTNAYSEGERSEFFLEMNPAPTMDLDGNLNIFIKMKQFVLFKFTESFLISIDGQLDDPQFHLKKKSFFGFM